MSNAQEWVVSPTIGAYSMCMVPLTRHLARGKHLPYWALLHAPLSSNSRRGVW